MYYIGTKTQAQYYIEKVNEGEQYNGITSTWSTPLQSFEDKEKYAVIKHDKYYHGNMDLVDSLPDEFSPPNTEI